VVADAQGVLDGGSEGPTKVFPKTAATLTRAPSCAAHEIVDAFTELERQLASPESDTRSGAPAGPVPRRRQTSP
jgi:hypothetical protein